MNDHGTENLNDRDNESQNMLEKEPYKEWEPFREMLNGYKLTKTSRNIVKLRAAWDNTEITVTQISGVPSDACYEALKHLDAGLWLIGCDLADMFTPLFAKGGEEAVYFSWRGIEENYEQMIVDIHAYLRQNHKKIKFLLRWMENPHSGIPWEWTQHTDMYADYTWKNGYFQCVVGNEGDTVFHAIMTMEDGDCRLATPFLEEPKQKKSIVRSCYGYYGAETDYEEEFCKYTLMAEQGDMDAMIVLIDLYNSGRYTAKPEIVAKYMRELDRKQYLPAAIYLASDYASGKNLLEQDIPKAIAWYEKMANSGDGLGYECLGEMYYCGEVVPRDYDKAMVYYTLAGNRFDLLESYVRVAEMYEHGCGTDMNLEIAGQCYALGIEQLKAARRAISQGSPKAVERYDRLITEAEKSLKQISRS